MFRKRRIIRGTLGEISFFTSISMPENFEPYNLEKAQEEAKKIKDIVTTETLIEVEVNLGW